MASNKKSEEKKNIKTYNHYLWIFILINFSIFMCISLGKDLNLNNISELYKNFSLKDGLLASISTLITFILNGVLSREIKYILVYWKVKNALPGYRIFTDFIDKDSRIDKSVLIKKYGDLPTDPIEQNKLWYKIYKPNEFDPMIFESQRNFLLSRDLTGMSFLCLMIFTTAGIISGVKFEILVTYALYLLVQYIILSLVCRNYGKQFSCNAVALICIKK